MSRYLLDTTVLIAHLRGEEQPTGFLLDLLAAGQMLGTSYVEFFATTREAATRAGRYQADFSKKGRTIHTPDALTAGTARAHGAVIVTDNRADFPMSDIRVQGMPIG